MSELSFIHGDRIALDDDPIDLRCERCGDEASVQDSKETHSWCALCAPDILIEVSDGGAIVTRKNEEVTVLIIDHDEIQFMKWDEECKKIAKRIQPGRWDYPRGMAVPEELYSLVAHLYVKLLEVSRLRVIERLSEEMNVPISTSKERIRKARKLGFLSSPGKGGPGSSAIKDLRKKENNKWVEADNDLAIQHAIQDFQWKKLGSKQIDSFMYASVGYMYLKFIQERKKHPVMQLAKFMNCPRATASARLAKARALGLLTSNNVGSFGGNLTAKGKTILNSTADTTREESHV